MKKENQQTPAHALEQALQESIKEARHARKLITEFVTALLQVRTSNLVKIANAVESDAESNSVYRRIQRFLTNDNQLAIDFLKLLKLTDKLKILIDPTEWKFGSTWVNILTLRVAYKNVAIPLPAEVMSHKGNAGAPLVIGIIERFVAEFGAARIECVYADREFGTRELFAYLSGAEIDFQIRLKTNHLTAGRSFKQIGEKAAQRVKFKGRREG